MLGKLIANENTKIYARRRTWIMFALLVALAMLASWIHHTSPPPNATTWRAGVQQTIAKIQAKGDSLASSAEDRAQTKESLALLSYRLSHTTPVSSSGLSSAQQFYITHINLLTPLITLLAIIIAADSVTAEFAAGTIKLLLIRPASRLSILLAKYCASLLFILLCYVILFLYAILASALILGPTEAFQSQPMYQTSGAILVQPWLLFLAIKAFSHAVSILLIVTMTFTVATICHNPLLATSLGTLSALMGTSIVPFLKQTSWGKPIAKYFLFTYLDANLYEKGPSALALTIVISYYAVFLFLASFIFNNRDIL